MKNLAFIVLTFIIAVPLHAQYDYQDSNRIGISGGINQFTLNTSDFDTKPGTGWNAGLSVRGNFYNDFDMVYGIQFSENNFTAEGSDGLLTEDVDFKLASAQISLLLSYKIVPNHLSVELGPMVQINGKLKTGSGQEDHIIGQTGLTADEIADVSKFSFYPTFGVTAGIKHLRVNVSYQYGVTNLLGNVEGNYKGNGGILSGNLIIYL